MVDLGGVPLLLFIMHWCNWLLVAAWLQRDKSLQRMAGSPLGLAGLIQISAYSYGLWRMSEIDPWKMTRRQRGSRLACYSRICL